MCANNKKIKVLFVGLGSIGTRHLKNLHNVANKMGVDICAHALRFTSDNNAPKVIEQEIKDLLQNEYTFNDIEKLSNYDAIYITNPTSMHYDCMKVLKDKTNAWFIEKPIFDIADYDLNACMHNWQKAYVAAPMRYCKTMLKLEEILPALKVYSARVICSSYLPQWRKGVDYRTTYSANKNMGGGVTIDLIHEWDYLYNLFGMPLKLHNFKGKYSHLEIDSDDISVYIAQYKNLLCEVHLDYFGREYKRSIELYCKEGTVIADFGKCTLTLQDNTVLNFEEEVNERYLKETEYFINYVLGDEIESTNTPKHALQVLNLTQGILNNC